MKKYAWLLMVLVMALHACQEAENKPNDFTGNEATYPLYAGADYNIYGSITFRERTDGSALAVVQLHGTTGSMVHPVHLHLGDIGTPAADIAVLLNPVPGNTGHSETVIRQLADETPITYAGIIELYACIKVHLAESGPERDIILAGGNIGEAYSAPHGRRSLQMAVCKSE